MGLFDGILGGISGFYFQNSRPDFTDQHNNPYIGQLNAMIEKQRRDDAIKKKFAEDLKKHQEKSNDRTIEGEYEVIDSEIKSLKGDEQC